MLACIDAEMAQLSTDWQRLLRPIFTQPKHHGLWQALAKEDEQQIFPPPGKRLAAFAACPLSSLSVVILGQDPYHRPGQAEGLSFSVPLGQRIPPSLVNVFKALANDGWAPPGHGHLSAWANQGVLLLNQVLTVRATKANSHARLGWQPLMTEVLQAIQGRPAVAHLLWGAQAQKFAHCVAAEHLLLTAVHPSPLSAHRGFFDCHHFSQANAWLLSKGLSAIDWSAQDSSLMPPQ